MVRGAECADDAGRQLQPLPPGSLDAAAGPVLCPFHRYGASCTVLSRSSSTQNAAWAKMQSYHADFRGAVSHLGSYKAAWLHTRHG